MSSMYRQALRALLEKDLICPACGAENIPGKPADIQLEDPLADRAGCANCGRFGPLTIFQRRKECQTNRNNPSRTD